MSLAHKDDYFETPDWLFNKIKSTTGGEYGLDMCASKENTKCNSYITEEMNVLDHNFKEYSKDKIIFCNPPRSKNGKFVNKVYEEWQTHNIPFVMLLCWNDLGNKYGDKLISHIINEDIKVYNLGKIKFYKDGIESEFVSRLTYFWAWFKSK